MALIDRPSGRFERLVLQAPTWLYRARLGWLLGSRFLCIVHRGRKTGKRRYTVVEVVRFDDRGVPEAVVTAMRGPHTQWYRNLEAAPAEEVRVGRRRWRRPGQRFLEAAERAGARGDYVREHPRAAKGVARALGTHRLDAAGIRELADRIRSVAFRPQS